MRRKAWEGCPVWYGHEAGFHPERGFALDNKKPKVYKAHMDKYLSIPEVARRLGVHRNSVLYWVRMGFVKAVPKNSFVSRPQFQIAESEVKRLERERHVAAKRPA